MAVAALGPARSEAGDGALAGAQALRAASKSRLRPMGASGCRSMVVSSRTERADAGESSSLGSRLTMGTPRARCSAELAGWPSLGLDDEVDRLARVHEADVLDGLRRAVGLLERRTGLQVIRADHVVHDVVVADANRLADLHADLRLQDLHPLAGVQARLGARGDDDLSRRGPGRGDRLRGRRRAGGFPLCGRRRAGGFRPRVRAAVQDQRARDQRGGQPGDAAHGTTSTTSIMPKSSWNTTWQCSTNLPVKSRNCWRIVIDENGGSVTSSCIHNCSTGTSLIATTWTGLMWMCIEWNSRLWLTSFHSSTVFSFVWMFTTPGANCTPST